MKRIRIKARVVPQPCIYLHICQGACEWCKTHMYTEACVSFLQKQCNSLRRQFWRITKARRESEEEKAMLQKAVDDMREHFREVHAQPKGTLYTLEEIAEAICHSTPCNDECPGWKYHCRKGNTGTLRWLQAVMNFEEKEVE